MNPDLDLTFHHTGYLVRDIEASKKSFRELRFNDFSETIVVAQQKVKVCFIKLSEDIFAELVEPFADNDTLIKLMETKGNVYHLGYLTHEFDDCLTSLENEGFYLINTFRSEAFGNMRCAFLYTPDVQLIEIIEKQW